MVDRADRKPEVDEKLQRIRGAMAEAGIGVAVFSQSPHVAWLAAGAATFVNTATEQSVVTLVVTLDHAFAITDTIEAPRMDQEERLPALGFDLVVEPWYAKGAALGKLIADHPVWRDTETSHPLSAAFLRLRTALIPAEIVRLRQFSLEAAAAVEEAALHVQPGMTEHTIAALIDRSSRERGGQATVNLVATDDRIARFRHPLPTAKTLDRYAMLVLCYRRDGFVISATRLVHFGPLPAELAAKAQALAAIDATIIAGTLPGRTLGELFALVKAAYHDAGYPTAIDEHHQGGLAGYRSREVLATPDQAFSVASQQMYAWNPSLRGVKSEDSILISENGPEILTATGAWPTVTIEIGGQRIARPVILER